MGGSIRIVAGLAIVAMAVGCGKKAEERRVERAIEKASGGKTKVDLQSGKMTYKDKDGSEGTVSMGGGVPLPAKFPKDVFVYPKASITQAHTTKNKETMIAYNVADAPEKVVEAYSAAMKKEGWEESSSMQNAGMSMLQFKKNGRETTIMVQKPGDQTTVNVSVDESGAEEPGSKPAAEKSGGKSE